MSFVQEEKKLVSILWSYVSSDMRNLYLTIFWLLVNTGLTIATPFYFQRALSIIETVVEPDNILLEALLIALSLFFIFSILSWIATATIMVYSTKLNANVIQKIRYDTFSSLLKNNVEFFDHHESGELVSILSNDLNELYETGNAIAEVLTASLKLLGILLILFYFSPLLTLTSMVMIPIFFLVTIMIRKYRRTAESNWRRSFGRVNQSFAEIMRSLPVSKAFNREQDNIRNFTFLNERTYRASIKRGAVIFVTRPIADFLKNVLLILILAVGVYSIRTGNLTVAVFYLFIYLQEYYFEPVRAISQNYNRFQSLFANLNRILSIALDDTRYEDISGKLSLDNFQGNLEFKNVVFAYKGTENILNDINFKVGSGQRLALVGHTGAGKSTIASLIMRFYEINSGEILLDGKQLKEYSLESLRRNIALVSQRVLLFKGTIRDNLLIGNPDATDDDLWQSIDSVQAREFIDLLPGGLDYKIEANGKNLSAGQRQMLSFARALLSQPKLIILDEATSAVDLYTESMIQRATDLLLSGTTSIVIAHRLTTIIKSDVIVVLEDGNLVQVGSHETLLGEGGTYQEMYDIYFQTQSAEYLETIKR
jgi:ATP-binding cassette, subfamily B, multidrug efflux pump